MNNFERIKTMTIEEMEDALNTNVFEKVGYIRYQAYDYFYKTMQEWFGGTRE